MRKLLIVTVLLISFLTSQSQSIYNEVDSLFKHWDKNSPGAAVGIIKNGELIYSKGYGVSQLEHNVPITPSTRFYIGSVAKQFVAFSILLLEEKNKLSMEDDIQLYLEDFPKYPKSIKIKDLIHHTSGIQNYYSLLWLRGEHSFDCHKMEKIYSVLKSQKKPKFEAGSRYEYSNSNYLLLALIIEKVSGQSLKDFTQTHIFDPLGMNSTTFSDNVFGLIHNRANSYWSEKEKGFANMIRRSELVGAGGLYSTIDDLYLWDKNLENNKLGKGGHRLVKAMLKEGTLNNGQKSGYAFGIENGKYKGLTTIGHTGAHAGYKAIFLRFPDKDFTVIILANRNDIYVEGKARAITDLFLAKHYPKEKGKKAEKEEKDKLAYKVPNTIELPDSVLKNFCGDFWNEQNLLLRNIYLKDNALWYLKTDSSKTKLIPISENQFIMDGLNTDHCITFQLSEKEEKQYTFSLNGKTISVFNSCSAEDMQMGELEKYEGLYYSEELLQTYSISLQKGTLVLYINGKRIGNFSEAKNGTLQISNFGNFKFIPKGDSFKGFYLDGRGVGYGVENIYFNQMVRK